MTSQTDFYTFLDLQTAFNARVLEVIKIYNELYDVNPVHHDIDIEFDYNGFICTYSDKFDVRWEISLSNDYLFWEDVVKVFENDYDNGMGYLGIQVN